MHTPGPWLFSPVNDCAVAIVEGDGTSIFDVTVGSHTTGQSTLAANAALVAAAPDLLAALQHMVEMYQRYFNVMPVAWQTADDIACAAIARATGGQ